MLVEHIETLKVHHPELAVCCRVIRNKRRIHWNDMMLLRRGPNVVVPLCFWAFKRYGLAEVTAGDGSRRKPNG
jgi:hypothetical protein